MWSGAWRLVQVALLLVVAGLLYLIGIGFPDRAVRWLEQHMPMDAGSLHIHQVRLHPLHGVVASHVQWYADADDRIPLLHAGTVQVGFQPRQWLHRVPGPHQVQVRDLMVRLDPDRHSVGIAQALPQTWLVAGLDIDLQWKSPVMHIQIASGKWAGLKVQAQGDWIWTGEAPPLEEPTVDPADFWADPPAWLARIFHDLQTLRFDGPALLDIDFSGQDRDWRAADVELRLQTEALGYRGLEFDALDIHIQLHDHIVQWPLAALRIGDMELNARGVIMLDTEQAEFFVASDLHPVYWRNLVPDMIRQPMDFFRIHCLGPTYIEFLLGPADWSELGKQVRGYVQAEEVEAHGLWIDKITANIVRMNDHVEVFNIDSVLGRNEGQGPATGYAVYDLDQHIYHGKVDAALDPHIVLPVAGYSQIAGQIIQSIQVDRENPELNVAFSGGLFPEPLFNFTGRIAGKDFIYAGSRIQSFEGDFVVTNRVMRIDPMEVVRREGRVTGWYEQDFDQSHVRLDVRSGIDPRALGRLAGGTVDYVLRQFRFDGPVDVSVRGVVDYGDGNASDYVARGRGESIGWRWLEAEACVMDWIAQGHTIVMTNLTMDMYGGTINATVELDQVGLEEEPVRYVADGIVEEVAFARLLRDLRQTEEDLQEGVLSGHFEVQGLAEADWRASLTGSGRVRIADGEIFQIRLFGGLSDLLRRIYPRLGLAVQTDVRANFTIADRAVRSDDIRIEGHILSLRGRGYYYLDDALDFRVQVLPLKRGLLVDLVRVFTYPVSRLLQFRLEGSLAEPEWKMDAIPSPIRDFNAGSGD